MTTLDQALLYRGRGWSVIPLKPKDKRPLIKWEEFQSRLPSLEELHSWFDHTENNLAIVTGKVSDLTVIDADSEEAVELCGQLGIDTGPQVTTGKGKHFYCQYLEGSRNFAKRKELPGIDLRSEGGYVVAPPSIHPSGALYTWYSFNIALPRLPKWVLSTQRGLPAQEGSRNVAATSLAGSCAQLNLPIELAKHICLTWNEKNPAPLGENEILQSLDSAYRIHARKNVVILYRTLDEIPEEQVSFLWRPYLPHGELCMLAGHPGVGKSYLSLALAADITRGKLPPDGSVIEPQRVIIYSAEDSQAKTIKPRLKLLGADSKMIRIAQTQFTLNLNTFQQIKNQIEEFKPGLVIIDPFTAFIDGNVKMNMANEVREKCSPLINIAHELNVVILLLHHYGKNLQVDSALHRVLGSQDLTAAPRSVLAVQMNEERKTLVHIKHNLSAAGKSLTYEIKDDGLYWLGESDLKASELVGDKRDRENSKQKKAEEWLGELLSKHPMRVKDLVEIGKKAGISYDTLNRARKSLSVEREQINNGTDSSYTVWKLGDF